MLYAVPVWACYAATETWIERVQLLRSDVHLTLLLLTQKFNTPSFSFIRFFSRQKQVNSTERTWLLCGVTHTQVYSESPLFSVFFMNQLNFPSDIRIKHWSLLSPWAFPLYLFLSFISSAFQPVHVKESCKILPKIARVQTWARDNIRTGMMNP